MADVTLHTEVTLALCNECYLSCVANGFLDNCILNMSYLNLERHIRSSLYGLTWTYKVPVKYRYCPHRAVCVGGWTEPYERLLWLINIRGFQISHCKYRNAYGYSICLLKICHRSSWNWICNFIVSTGKRTGGFGFDIGTNSAGDDNEKDFDRLDADRLATVLPRDYVPFRFPHIVSVARLTCPVGARV